MIPGSPEATSKRKGQKNKATTHHHMSYDRRGRKNEGEYARASLLWKIGEAKPHKNNKVIKKKKNGDLYFLSWSGQILAER